MPKTPRDQQQRTLTLPHELSPNYIAAYADSMTINVRADEVGAVIQMNFTRGDASPRSEEFPVFEADGFVRQIGPPVFQHADKKVVECAVIMRPDQAAAAAAGLLNALAGLPEHIKRAYQIQLTNSPQP